MKRRRFLQTALLSGAALSASAGHGRAGEKPDRREWRDSLSFDDHRLAIFTRAPVRPTRIFHLTDTHLSLDDARGAPYRQYSRRMAGAYQRNRHFQTGETLTSAGSFTRTLNLARERKADFLVLTGDIFSFPSEAAVEWAHRRLQETGIPFAYVAGNHDWHYEGLPGSSRALRDEWIRRRLRPMYQGHDPLAAAYDLNGLRFVTIDDSTYEILPEQLAFLRKQIRTGIPFFLLVHIPLYIPGRGLGYGCAHPDWGAQADKNHQIERRERWREGGHTKTTLSFYDEVFRAPNLLAILAGHTHRLALEVRRGIPQVVGGANARGEFLDLQVQTTPGENPRATSSESRPES
jgi:3',5'-cyclic AMP phosphodiesterase CpdA